MLSSPLSQKAPIPIFSIRTGNSTVLRFLHCLNVLHSTAVKVEGSLIVLIAVFAKTPPSELSLISPFSFPRAVIPSFNWTFVSLLQS